MTGADFADLFLMSREAEGRAANTIRNYRTAAAHLVASMPDDPAEWTSDDLVRWLAQLRAEKRSPALIAWYQRHAFTFVGWLYDRGELERDIRRGVARVRAPREPGRAVTDESFERLLLAARARPTRVDGTAGVVRHYWRGIAALHLLYATGVRRAELCALELADLDMTSGIITVRAESAKTKRQRRVPFDSRTRKAIGEYIARERGKEPGPLFRMSSNALKMWLDRLGDRAGVDVASHDFRRGFAAKARRQGLDLGHLMTALGHTSPVMSRLYSSSGEEDSMILAYRQKVG